MLKLGNALETAEVGVGAVPAALSEEETVDKPMIGRMRRDEHYRAWTGHKELVRDKFVEGSEIGRLSVMVKPVAL